MNEHMSRGVNRQLAKPVGRIQQLGLQHLGLLLILLCLSVGCQSSEVAVDTGERIGVVTTVGMVADIVKNVGGEAVEVQQVMGSGVDPHLYKATRDDVRMILQADVVFLSGLMLEGKMTSTLDKLGKRRPVIAVAERIPKDYLLASEDGEDDYDPHVWMDADAWRQCIPVVGAGLIELSPELAEPIQSRMAAYDQQLAALDRYATTCIASIPKDKRLLITSHDAFSYFGKAYGIEVLAVQGLSTESEAGLQQINKLVDLLVKRDIQAVFVESSVPRKNIQALIDGAESRGHKVKIGGELFSDAMGPPGTYEGTYIGMLEHNINTITQALGGHVPAGGFAGSFANTRETTKTTEP